MARHALTPSPDATSPQLPLVGPLRVRTTHRRPEHSPFPRPLPCPAAPSVVVAVTPSTAVRLEPHKPGPVIAQMHMTYSVDGAPSYSPLKIEPRRRRIPRIEWSTVICSLITLLIVGVPLVLLLFGQGTSVSACWSEDGSRAHAVDGPWC